MKKLICSLLLLFTSFFLEATDFRIVSLDIQAELKEDASLQVEETLLYDISDINGILFDLDAKGNGPLKEVAVYATDENEIFQRIPNEFIELTEEDELYHFKVYAKTLNQKRKFKITYTLEGGAFLYNDIGEINRVFVGKHWSTKIDHVSVRVLLPKSIPLESIRAFGHGPLTGNVDIEPYDIFYSLTDYYPGDFIEAHILFDPKGFSNVPTKQRRLEDAKERILALEKQLAEDANAKRKQAKYLKKQGNIFAGIEGVLLALIALFFHYVLVQFSKLFIKSDEYLRELPDNNSPAIVGRLFGKDTGELIFPTFMDLVRRKHLLLETRGEEQYLVRPENPEAQDTIRNYEEELIKTYIDDLGDGKEINLSNLTKKKSPKEMRALSFKLSRKLESYSRFILQEYKAKNFKTESSRWQFVAIFFCALCIVFFLYQITYFNNIFFLLLVPIMIIFVIVPLSNAKFPTKEMKEAIFRWKSFKNFLEDYSLLSEAQITSIHLWEHYFVYALVLDVAENVLKAYNMAIKRGDLINSLDDGFVQTSFFDLYEKNPRILNTFPKMYDQNKEYSPNSSRSIGDSRTSSSSGFFGGGFSSGSSGGGGSRGGGGAF